VSSLSVPSGLPYVQPGRYDSSIVERQAQHATRTRDPFLTMDGGGFAAALDRTRNIKEIRLTAAEEEERRHEFEQAAASAHMRAEVPSRFPGGVYFIQHGPGGPIKIGYTASAPLAR
jgi:hypothetical protein